jgi:hypothetical protein
LNKLYFRHYYGYTTALNEQTTVNWTIQVQQFANADAVLGAF